MCFSFWDEQSLKVRCLHFLSGFVNEHRWDPTVMRQGQASGREEIIHLTLEEAENLCSGSFKHDKFWKVFCCQSVVYGPQITLVSCQRISTLKWFEMARRGGREGNVRARRKGNRKKSWWVKRDCSVMNISNWFPAPSSALITVHFHQSLPANLIDLLIYLSMWMYLFACLCRCSRLIIQWGKYTRITSKE